MAADRADGGFGGRLRDARQRRDISLREIANVTKISVAALEALERNDISRLPGGIFTRAFVRSYAVHVGLDPETTIKDFITQFPNDSVTAGHPATRQIDADETLDRRKRLAGAAVALVAIAIPLAAVLAYFLLSGYRDRTAADPPGATTAPTTAPATAPVAADARATVDEAAAGAQFVLGVSATATSFVSAVVDGERAVEREMKAGERELLIVHREVVLTAADAGAVALTLDGADAKPIGKSGDSATVRLDTSNFKDYLAPR